VIRRVLVALALVAGVVVPVAPTVAQQPEPKQTVASRGPAGCEIPVDRPVPGSGAVLRVGSEKYPTVSDAVRAARAGDTVLIPPGRYSETVVVEDDLDASGRPVHRRDGLRITGLDRAAVVFDGALPGGDHLESAFIIRSDRVVLENLTVRHYSRNPLQWSGVEGFWGRYLTVYGGGVQNVAAASRCGQLDHVYMSGMATAALAVAGCFPCDTTVVDSVVENSWIGFASLNARGGLHLGRPGAPRSGAPDNVSRRNHMGALIVNEDITGPAPGAANAESAAALQGASDAGTWVSGNLFEDNDNGGAVAPCGDEPVCKPTGEAFGVLGIGIYVVGVRGSRVEHNVVRDHDRYGIGVFGFPGGWPAVGNTIVGNDVSGTASGFDLVQDASAGPGNCWAGNSGVAAPAPLQTAWGCGRGATPPGGVPAPAVCMAGQGSCQRSLRAGDRHAWAPLSWKAYNANGEHITDERAWVDLPDEGAGRSRRNDGAIDTWLPEVRPYCTGGSCGA
jgi:hypothetical protein